MNHSRWDAAQNVKQSLRDTATIRQPLLDNLRDLDTVREAPPVPSSSPTPHNIRENFIDVDVHPRPPITAPMAAIPTNTAIPSAFLSSPNGAQYLPSPDGVVGQTGSSSTSVQQPAGPPAPVWPTPVYFPHLHPQYSHFYWPSAATDAQPQTQPPMELVIAQQRVAQADARRQPLGLERQKVLRHCAKCGKPQKQCKGAQNQKFCLNPCQFCKRQDCSGKDTSVRGSRCLNAPSR